MSDYYETPWVDDHDPLCPPYLGARGGRAEWALERARAEERERIARAMQAWWDGLDWRAKTLITVDRFMQGLLGVARDGDGQ